MHTAEMLDLLLMHANSLAERAVCRRSLLEQHVYVVVFVIVIFATIA